MITDSPIRQRLRAGWDKKRMLIEIDEAFKKGLENQHFKNGLELSMGPSPFQRALAKKYENVSDPT